MPLRKAKIHQFLYVNSRSDKFFSLGSATSLEEGKLNSNQLLESKDIRHSCTGCLNIHGTHVTANNSTTNNNIVFFFILDLKIESNNDY